MPLLARLSENSQRLSRSFFALVLFFVAFSGTLVPAARAQSSPARVPVVTVDTTPSHMLNSFDPDRALGSSVDVLSHNGIDKVYTPHILQESLSAGWGPITYRNNTELRMAAWHWTENGTWSDPAHKSGYFTGSTDLKEPTRYILAYALPHRGFSTSGDRPVQAPNLTYWKSNPYLTSKFTGESDALHPQWVVVDLRARRSRSAPSRSPGQIRSPSPTRSNIGTENMRSTSTAVPREVGRRFPNGSLKNAKGGTVTLKLSDAPVTTQYMRVLMTESSNTCDLHGSSDIRNCVGYAIQEIHAGSIDASGAFIDVKKDATGKDQPTYCSSSIDPWHSAEDVNATGNYQHTGFDLFFTSGITNNLPAMIPVTMLYGTPDDSAAQIAYIEKRGYPIGYIEMGEEPDGKHAMPEDYGALYIQWADAIHKVDPKLKLGGPIFEGVNEDIRVWPDAQGRTSWMGRFVDYLKTHASPERPGLRLVRALSVRAVRDYLEVALRRAAADEAHPAGLARRRRAQRCSAHGHREPSGRKSHRADEHDLRRTLARRQHRLILRRRWRRLLSFADSAAGIAE